MDSAISLFVDTERGLAPYRTGNLMNNGISDYEKLTITTATYWINRRDSKKQAPYGILLNEAPMIRGNVNVHYHWHDNAFYYACQLLAAELGGKLS